MGVCSLTLQVNMGRYDGYVVGRIRVEKDVQDLATWEGWMWQ